MKQEIDIFLDYLSGEKGLSENTIAAYRNDLYQLVSFIEQWAQQSEKLAGTINHWAAYGGPEEALGSLLKTIESGYVPSLSPPAQPDQAAVLESLRKAATNENYKGRPKDVTEATKGWVQLSKADALAILEQVLPWFAEGPLSQFLWDLQAIAPVILKLGGQELVEATIEEVDRVMGWWSFSKEDEYAELGAVGEE